MITLLIIILVAFVIAVPIALVALRINGGNNEPWPHDAMDNEHRWED